MSTQPLLVVVGATGTQGRSVINYFLSHPATPPYKIRGITRNPTSTSSLALTAKGVEMVSADLNSLSTLSSAFDGATAIFAVTDFWQPFWKPENQAKAKSEGKSINQWSYEYEVQQAKNIFAAAAKIEGLEKFIFSSLANAKKWSGGKYTWVYHFDGKADAVEYLKSTYQELWSKTSVVLLGGYLSNFLPGSFFSVRKLDDGTFGISGNAPPSTAWPLIATEEDTGIFVKALIDSSPGKNLVAYREMIRVTDFMDVWSKVTGEKGVYREVSFKEVEEAAGPLVGREIAETYGFVGEFGYEGRSDATLMYPEDLDVEIKLPSVEDWVKQQDWSGVINPQG